MRQMHILSDLSLTEKFYHRIPHRLELGSAVAMRQTTLVTQGLVGSHVGMLFDSEDHREIGTPKLRKCQVSVERRLSFLVAQKDEIR